MPLKLEKASVGHGAVMVTRIHPGPCRSPTGLNASLCHCKSIKGSKSKDKRMENGSGLLACL